MGRVIHPVSVFEASTPRLPTAAGMTRDEFLMYENRSFEQFLPTQFEVQNAQASFPSPQPNMAQGGRSQPMGEAFLRSLQGQPPPPPHAPSVQEFSPLRPFPQAGSLPPHRASLYGPPLAWSAPQGITPGYLPLSDSQMQQAITKLVAPVFKPHEGMVHHLKYAAGWSTLFHSNFYTLENNTALQFHLLLGSCTSPSAEQFLVSNVEAIIAQCADPLAGQLLRSLTNKGNARSTGGHFMHLSQLLHGESVANLATPPRAQALSINDSNLPRDLIDAANAAYTVKGHSGKSLHLIWAWISIRV